MAPGRKRGAKGVKTKSELSLGDLVLAKVKGFPAWPAKISRPEDWERSPDPKKYFVQFYGTSEIAFVAPADIQAFTSESKNKLTARCQGKTVRYFAQAVKEICEEFEVSQLKNLSGVRDDNNAQNLASETHPVDPVVDEALEVSRKDGIDNEGPNCKLETKGLNDLGSGLEHCSGRQDEMECQDVKPCSSNDVMHSLSPHLSSGKRNKLSTDPTNQVKNLVLRSSPSKHVVVKEEGSGGVKVKGWDSDGAQSEMGNGHKSKLTTGTKRKHGDAMHQDNGPIMSPKNIGDGVQSKHVPDRNMKLSSADNSKPGLHIASERKGKNLLKEKKHSGAVDDDRVGEVMSEEHNEVVSRKKMKVQHDHQKQTSRKDEASCPKMSKGADVVNDASMLRVQSIRKHDSRSYVDLDDKMDKIEPKSSTSGGKAENHRLLKAQTSTKESRDSNDEDDLPPMKRHGRPLSVMSTSALITENRSGTASRKPGMMLPNKIRSPIKQQPTKRRAVRLCDDDDDELPKTPIHGSTQKVPAIPRISDSKRKNVVRGESYANDQPVLRNSGIVEGALKGQVPSTRVSNKASSSPIAEQGMVKGTRESSAEHLPSSTPKLDSEKIPLMDDKPVTVSPKRSPISIPATKSLTEPPKKQLSEAPSSISQKKVRPGLNRGLDIASDRSTSSLNHSTTESSKPTSTEKWRKTPKSDSQINDSVPLVGHHDESTTSLGQRLDVAKDTKTSIAVDLKFSDSATSMKNLIAAAQARKRQAHLQKSYGITLPLLVPDADMLGRSPGTTPATLAVESSNTFQLDVERLHSTSPFSDVRQSISEHENEEHEERRVSSGRQATGSSLSGGTEAAVARDAFEGMIETLSRTKESIGRATRLAIDCAKYGIANEVVELLIQKLENEPSFHRKVDLFFLVDSITQCSHSQKGIAGASYIPTVQAALPRLIGAAAPPGTVAQENRRQCHKVLRLWLERKIFPDHVLRKHMDDIGTVNIDTSAGFSQRRPSRAERAIDDPIREMEGMLVDEYGSNATFQLPGLLSSRLFEEEDEDEDNFPINLYKEVADTSPSEHTPASRDPETHTVTPSDRRHCILEEVDGELEMEDVSGHQKDERPLFGNDTSAVEPNSDVIFESASNLSELLSSPEGSPPLPPGSPPVTPPLPDSPPPSSPPPPPPPPPPPMSSPSPPPPPPPPPSSQHIFPPPPFGPPPYLSQQSLPPQPALVSQNMPPLPSTVPTSQPLAHHPPHLPHEIGGPHPVNQHANMVSNAHGPRMDAPVRGEVFSQQSSFFSSAPVSNAREHVAYNSTRSVEYGQGDTYMNPQPSQQRQQFMSGSAPFAQRPLHPEPPQGIPSHFSYPNQVQQHEYPPYPLQNVSDGQRRYATDEQWRKQVNEFNADSSRGGWMTGGKSYPGYFVPPPERPATNGIGFQPSAANSLPAAPVSVHGIPMMPGRSDMSAVNWRPT